MHADAITAWQLISGKLKTRARPRRTTSFNPTRRLWSPRCFVRSSRMGRARRRLRFNRRSSARPARAITHETHGSWGTPPRSRPDAGWATTIPDRLAVEKAEVELPFPSGSTSCRRPHEINRRPTFCRPKAYLLSTSIRDLGYSRMQDRRTRSKRSSLRVPNPCKRHVHPESPTRRRS